MSDTGPLDSDQRRQQSQDIATDAISGTTDTDSSIASASLPSDGTVNNPGGVPNIAVDISEGNDDTVNGTATGPTAADKSEHAITSNTSEDLSELVASGRGNRTDSTNASPVATAADSNKQIPTLKNTSDLLSVTAGHREGSNAADSSTDLSLKSDTNILITLPSCTATTNFCTDDGSASPHAATAADSSSRIASTTLTVDGPVGNTDIRDSPAGPVIATKGDDATNTCTPVLPIKPTTETGEGQDLPHSGTDGTAKETTDQDINKFNELSIQCDDTVNSACELNPDGVTNWGNDNIEKLGNYNIEKLNDRTFDQQRGNITSGTSDLVEISEHQSVCSGIDQTSVSSHHENVCLDARKMGCGKSSQQTEDELESEQFLNTVCVVPSKKEGYNSPVSCATAGQQEHCNRQLIPDTGSNELITELREQSVANCSMPPKSTQRATPVSVADKVTNSQFHQGEVPKLKEHCKDLFKNDGEPNLQGSRQNDDTQFAHRCLPSNVDTCTSQVTDAHRPREMNTGQNTVVTYQSNHSAQQQLHVHGPHTKSRSGSRPRQVDSMHAKNTSTHQNTPENMPPAEECSSVVQAPASTRFKDQHDATASRARQKAQTDGQNQTSYTAQSDGRLHTEMENKSYQRVAVSVLTAELLGQEEVWKKFTYELSEIKVLISEQELHKQLLVILFGEEESLKKALDVFFTETSITVDETARSMILSMKHRFPGQFTSQFRQTDSQCQICYLRSVESEITPDLERLRTFEEHIPLPLYKVKYCLRHLEELMTACEREGSGKVQLKVDRCSDGKLCLQVKADRLKRNKIMIVVHQQLAKIVMRKMDIATDVVLFLQDDQVTNQCVQSIEANSGCLLSVRMPMQSLQVHAKSPKGQELMMCDGNIADSDSPVLVIPLHEGQTRWPYMYQQILKKGFLPEEEARYLVEVGSPEQKREKYTITLDCNKDLAGRKVVVMFVAQKDSNSFKHYYGEACREAMEAAFLSNSSVAFQLEDDIRASDKAWKVLLFTVKRTLESCASGMQVKLFLNMQTPHALDLCRHMEGYFVHCKWDVRSYFIKQDRRTKNAIRVVVDEMQDIEADVYVNSTDAELKHEDGLVSRILLTRAGDHLTAQCQKEYPEGIADNVVAWTKSFNLKNFRWIFHIVLHGIWLSENPTKQLQELKIRVQACLAFASELKCRTIALPTLGLGKLKYPPDRVAKTMFSAAREFFAEMPHSTLEHVSIVCYHKNHNIIKVFKFEEALCNPLKRNIYDHTFEINDAQVIIIQGDLHVLELGAKITVCGPHLKGRFEEYKEKSEATGSIVLQLTSKKAKDVVKRACKLCSADRKIVCLQIDMQTIEQGWHDELITALTSELHGVLVVYLVVASDGDLHAVAKKMKQVTSNSNSKWSLPSFMTSESASKDTTSDSGGTPTAFVQEEDRGFVQIIGPWMNTQTAEDYVLSVPVPAEYTRRAHEYEKKKREGSSVDQKTSQYYCQPRSTDGHEGIEDEIKDAMREVTVEESSSGGCDTCSFTIPLDQLKKVDRGMFKQSLEQETKGMFQSYSEEGQNLVFRAAFEKFEHAVSLVCKIVRKLSGVESGNSHTIASKSQAFTMDFDMLEYEALTYLLRPTFSQSVSIVAKDNGKVSVCSKGEQPALLDKCRLLRREDVQMPADDLVRLGQEQLDTTDESLEAFIKPLHDQGKVAILAFDYNTITKAKHLVSVKAGKVKITARARRRFESAGQSEHSPPQSIDSLSSKSLAVNPKEFSTKSDIKVMVYKTDITKLPVDAIVNAANNRLAHGGGVAAAIAKAAGVSLEEEGNAYVTKNGPLKVTQVVPTTPGAMPCKTVLHAVGPRWDDYQDKIQCQQDLEQTVFNCMVSAHDGKLSSLAVSSISAAIFGVPKEICAQMYLSAVKSFDQKYGKRTSLCEIHFVDVSDHMVSVIQDVFTKGWNTDGTASGGIGTHNMRQVGVQPPETFNTAFACSSPLTGYSSGAQGEVSSVHLSSQGTRPPLGAVQANPPHTPRQQSNQGDTAVTDIMDTRLQQNDHVVHFVNLDLIFREQRVSGFPADAVVLWQYSDCLLESDNTKQLLQGLTSNVSGLKYKLTHGVVEVVMTDNKMYILPVASSSTTKENICTLFEQAMEKADKHGKKSVAVSCFSSQPDSKRAMKTNNDVVEYAAGIYLAINKYSDRPQRSVTQVYILETDVNTLRVIEETVGERFAIDRSMTDLVNNERQPAFTANMGARSLNDTSDRGSNERQCVICHDKITNLKTLKCGHVFCAKCIDKWVSMKPVCPSCKTVLGIMTGNQPANGTMRMHYSNRLRLPDRSAVYEINYYIPSGKQTEEHPNPGRFYSAISRNAYLPDTTEGRKVLMLLKVAFDRRLVFTVGRSATSGIDNCVIWNDIHHKTSTCGSYGYPDSTYLTRVQKELADKGVTYDVLTWKQMDFIQNPTKYHQYQECDFFPEFCGTDV